MRYGAEAKQTFGDGTAWAVTVLVALASAAIMLAYTQSGLPALAVGAGILMTRTAWVTARWYSARRQFRSEVNRGIAQLESWLRDRPRTTSVALGGVAERCPVCGRPSSPRTGRCPRHR